MIDNLESLPARQQPNWPDEFETQSVLREIGNKETLVTPFDTDLCLTQIGRVALGEAFMLQAGSCAESFSDSSESVLNFLKAILPMNMVLSYSAGLPVIKVGRIAGQYAKPRSSDFEEINGIMLPSFRGESVNSPNPDLKSRTPDPHRMIKAYEHSLETLHTLQKQTQIGGFADLDRMLEWNLDFIEGRNIDRYSKLINDIERAFNFMRSCGVTESDLKDIHNAKVFTSHEALILDFEQALTRNTPNGFYAGSGHMLWIGERTRDLNERHIGYCANVKNPIGIKIGPTTSREEILGLCETLNPKRIPGRLTLIVRIGSEQIRDKLPPLIEAVEEEEHVVAWIDDPMHGNTITGPGGRKTRKFDDIKDDIDGFFDAHEAIGTWPGGIHLELTGENVTECIGGSGPSEVNDLELRYETNCDPRLNGAQGIELAFEIAPRLINNRLLRNKETK